MRSGTAAYGQKAVVAIQPRIVGSQFTNKLRAAAAAARCDGVRPDLRKLEKGVLRLSEDKRQKDQQIGWQNNCRKPIADNNSTTRWQRHSSFR